MRIDRVDREVRICTEIERRINLFPFNNRPRIIRLIEAMDIPGDSLRTFWRRTTFWDWYNMGSTLNLRDAYAAQGAIAPAYVMARFLRQGLESIDWLLHPIHYGIEGQRPIFHNDMHAGNIFVHWTDRDEGPNFFVGDFGFARMQGEERPRNAEELAEMSPLTRRLFSTPRDTLDSPAPDNPLDVDGNPVREEWDVHTFLLSFLTTEDSLMRPYNMHLSGGAAVPDMPVALLNFIRELEDMNTRDTENAEGERSEWTGYQDLRPIIGRLRAYEDQEKAAHDGGATPNANNQAQVRAFTDQRAIFTAHRARVRAAQQPMLLNFEADANATIKRSGIPYPFAVVNINDAATLRTTQNNLATFVTQPPPAAPGQPQTPVAQVGQLAQAMGYGGGSVTSNPSPYGQVWQPSALVPGQQYALPAPFTTPPGQLGRLQYAPGTPGTPTPGGQWVYNPNLGPPAPPSPW